MDLGLVSLNPVENFYVDEDEITLVYMLVDILVKWNNKQRYVLLCGAGLSKVKQ
jgi:hypothetical protein